MKRVDRWDSLLQYHSEIAGLPFDRVKRQMIAESSADPKAVNPVSGAIGLFQLMPSTAADLGVNPHDIEDNVKGGTRYMALKILDVQRFLGSYPAAEPDIYRMALACYNAGAAYVMVAIQTIRRRGAKTTWDAFLPIFKDSRWRNPKTGAVLRPRWRDVDDYVHKILPPPTT